VFLRVFSIHVHRQDSTIFFHNRNCPNFSVMTVNYIICQYYTDHKYSPKSFSNSSNLIPFQVRRFKKLMRKAEGSSCLDHIVSSSQIEALNTTDQSGKYFDCILGVYAYTPFSVFPNYVCLLEKISKTR
jgi:hypothetical protein